MVAKRTGPSRSDNNSCASPSPWVNDTVVDMFLKFSSYIYYFMIVTVIIQLLIKTCYIYKMY